MKSLDGLLARREVALSLGSPKIREKRAAEGMLTARTRIDLLLDPESFQEIDQLARHVTSVSGTHQPGPYGDGLVAGVGAIEGRPVCVFAQDFAVLGGSMGESHGRKVLKLMDLAVRMGCPVISINDSGGARIQEGVVSLAYYAALGRRNALASGVVPQLALVAGPCAGGAVYSPALMDFTVMVDRQSYMFVTGPDVVRAVTGANVSAADLGGPQLNAARSGNAHHVAQTEQDAIDWLRELVSYLPSNSSEDPPAQPASTPMVVTDHDRELDAMIPDAPNRAYDVRDVVARIVDDGDQLEVHTTFAPNLVCGFARIDGHPVGIVANQPMHSGGVLDIDASEKGARFVRFCDAFNIPIITLVDVPGYLPGLDQETAGIIRRGAKLLHAYAEATVPMVTIVLRKAFGGAYAVMGSKHIGADVNLAWPTAQIAVMGEKAAVSVLHRHELAKAADEETRAALRERLAAEYAREMMTPYAAAERGYVDAVIPPHRTRLEVVRALRALRSKRADVPIRKHGNIPL